MAWRCWCRRRSKRDPHSGHLFVFRGRRGGLIKVLWHDGQGLCLFAKRLERGFARARRSCSTAANFLFCYLDQIGGGGAGGRGARARPR